LRISLRSKLSLAFLAVTLCCGVIAGAIVDHNVRRVTMAQFEDRLSYETTMLGQMTASALFGALDPGDTSLSEPVGALAAAVNTQLAVIANDGAVVADSSVRDPRFVPNQKGQPEILAASTRGVGTAIRDGRLYVAGAIVRDGKTLGFARSSISMAEIAVRLDVVRSRMIAGIGLALVLALLLGLVFASSLVRPIRALADGARRVGGGNFAHSIRVTASDELGELAGAFNEMTHDLRRAMERLDARNRDMRLVLDNVREGLLTIDRTGRMSAERSAMIDRWFGPPQLETTFATCLGNVDAAAGASFEMNWQAIVDGLMPVEVSLDQLPRRMTDGARHFALEYRLLNREGSVDGMLIVIADVSARVAAERAEEHQREIVNAFECVMRDRHGFLDFFDETHALVASLCGPERPSVTEVRRQLHTLKGNAGLFGLTTLVKLTHELEDATAELGGDLTTAQCAMLHDHWNGFRNRISAFLGDRIERRVDVDDAEYEALLRSLAENRDPREIGRMVSEWRLELAADRLGRLAVFARALAVRLGKAAPDVVVDADRVRLSRERLAPFWATFAHLVRNAVDHGLEPEAERREAGKSPAGTLRLRAAREREGDRIAFEVTDDGRGIDWRAVATKATAAGLPAEKHSELVEALFHDGLSTRDRVNSESGRGVGMSAFRAECQKLGGVVTVESSPGRGTTIRVTLPREPIGKVDALQLAIALARPEGASVVYRA